MLISSPLESQRFNIKSGKIQISSVAEIHTDLDTAKSEGYHFLTCRISTQEVMLFQNLESQGFFLTDTLVYYKSIVPEKALDQEWQSCLQRQELHQQIVEVATLCFKDYPSHYSMDRHLSPEKSHEVYPDWASRSFLDRKVATDVLGTFDKDKLVAFISVKDHMTHGEVLLAAVHPSYQGQGLLQKLLQASVAWAQKQGHKEIFYSTQIQNIAAQKALVRQGWEMSHSFYTLHCWL